MRNWIRSISSSLLTLLTLAPSAEALLIEADLFAAGDGLITLDTRTGLEWLDLTATVGLTYATVVHGAGGWTDLGFRMANGIEVCDLITSNAVPMDCTMRIKNPRSAVSSEFSTETFINLFGVWSLPEWGSIVTAGIFNDGTPWKAGRFEVVSGLITGAGYEVDSVDWFTSTASTGFFAISEPGYFLVRSSIPEPATGLLVGGGLVAFAAQRAGRRSSRLGTR